MSLKIDHGKSPVKYVLFKKKICVCGDVFIRVDRKESNIIYV